MLYCWFICEQARRSGQQLLLQPLGSPQPQSGRRLRRHVRRWRRQPRRRLQRDANHRRRVNAAIPFIPRIWPPLSRPTSPHPPQHPSKKDPWGLRRLYSFQTTDRWLERCFTVTLGGVCLEALFVSVHTAGKLHHRPPLKLSLGPSGVTGGKRTILPYSALLEQAARPGLSLGLVSPQRREVIRSLPSGVKSSAQLIENT